MQLLDESNAADYLRDAGLIDAGEDAAVRRLAGGVSNVVLYVDRKKLGADGFVLKQARGQLRVAQPWFCSIERIWREVDVLRVCAATLARRASEEDDAQELDETFPSLAAHTAAANTPAARDPSLARRAGVSVGVPHVLFEDRENYAFAMTAAPLGHRTWKADLLAGTFDPSIAAACGDLLGRLHAGTWQDAGLAKTLGDRTFFVDLRVDPYYRHVAGACGDLRAEIEDLIASLDAHRRCLVHGDFSPKNLLVWEAGGADSQPNLMLVDCEVGHFGDPAFDLGFFLSHLVLKGVYHGASGASANCSGPLALAEAFLAAYAGAVGAAISASEYDMLQQRAAKNLAGCLLARVDGKSPVEYLTGAAKRQAVRRIARELFARRDLDWKSVQKVVQGQLLP